MSSRLEQLWYPQGPESLWRRLALAPLVLAEGAFGLGVAVRGALFDRGVLRAHRIPGLRVVSVGNVNVGGAGKTPVTILVANLLRASGERAVVLSRGYGRKATGVVEIVPGHAAPPVEEAGDEPLLIAASCPQIPVLVGGDRVALARLARAKHQATVVVLDDGLQHRRLARDVDIVVVDAAARFGNGHLLPRGPLREPTAALRRATIACVRVTGDEPAHSLQLPIPAVVVRFAPVAWHSPGGVRQPVDALAGRSVVLLTAVARPTSVERTVAATGASIVRTWAFPDHHPFAAEELENVLRSAPDGSVIATTAKDRVRLPATFPAWTLEMDTLVVEGRAHLDAALRRPT